MIDAANERETDQIVCEARRDQLGELLAFVDAACARAGLAHDVAHDVRLAAEEVVTNVIEHGYAGERAGSVTVRLRREPRQVVVTIEDAAPTFDPATIPPADPSAPLECRRIGGLGWHLVTRVMDEVHHEPRHPQGNRVTLVKRLAPDA